MSQIQVKQIISSFVKILDYFGFSPVSAEELRLAKFNKQDVAEKMWKLLFELINYTKTSKKTLDSDFINETFYQQPSEKTIQFIKKEFIRYGYPNEDFFNLNESSYNDKNASREVLVAIGWFFFTFELIELFNKNSATVCEQEYFKDIDDAIKLISESEKELESLKLQLDNTKGKDLLSQLNYIRWLEGQFKYKLNAYYSSALEKAKLTHKIHQLSKSEEYKPFGHLSCFEFYLLNNPDKMEKVKLIIFLIVPKDARINPNFLKYAKVLDKKIEFQESILFFLQNEEYFWKWMSLFKESVLEEKNYPSKTDEESVEFDVNISKKYEPDFKSSIQKNINEIKKAESDFEKSIINLKTIENELSKGVDISEEQLEECAKRSLNELKEFESEIKYSFSNKPTTGNKNQTNENEQINFMDKNEPRLILKANKNKLDKASIDKIVQHTVKEEVCKLKNEFKSLNDQYLKEKEDSIKKCKSIADEFKDCHIVYSK